ncbi:MAG TPA: hypothetical protein VNY74_06630 [Edaphobacter sp.]|jgi:hypothetical protein|nr:hypothetical protein [Edaphobacter sp.]
MKERILQWLSRAGLTLKKNAVVILLFFAWEIPKKLGEDRIIGGMNRALDAHATAIAGFAKPVVAWLISTPFLLPIAVVTGILIHAYWDTQKSAPAPSSSEAATPWPPPMPLARTTASQTWLYTPLKEIYRRDYHDEEVPLDGYNFIDCSFGKNVTFVFEGLAPFKMIDSKPTAEFVMSMKTGNLSIQHLLKFLRDTNSLGGQFMHHPPPQQ